MSIVLFHHPYSRAANMVWALEEVGVPYTLRTVDLMKGDHKSPEILALNSMGKLPVLTDGDAVMAETSAIGMYLADRYALGRLSPALDDRRRGEYLRWCVFPSAVIEPACMAQSSGWEYKPGQAGFGSYETVLASIEGGVAPGPWLLGDRFTMADVLLGSTLRWMLMFKMIEARPSFEDYVARLVARPAWIAADAKNTAVRAELGLR
jgi:glutathione S-transferase